MPGEVTGHHGSKTRVRSCAVCDSISTSQTPFYRPGLRADSATPSPREFCAPPSGFPRPAAWRPAGHGRGTSIWLYSLLSAEGYILSRGAGALLLPRHSAVG